MHRTSGQLRWLIVPVIGCLVLLGCGGSGVPGGSGEPGGKVEVTDEPEPTETDRCIEPTFDPEATEEYDGQYDDAYLDYQDCLAAGGGGGGGGASPLQGEWTGTLTYNWTQTVEETGPGMHSLQKQTYHATVDVTSTQVDIKAWELSGKAFVTASWSSLYDSHLDTPLGPCDEHHFDEVPENAPRQVDITDGGLEVGDVGGLYQFHVSLWGFELTSHTIRDYSGCTTGHYVEDVPWPVAATTLGDSGTVTDRTHLKGTLVKPNSTGDDTMTYDLRLN